MSARSLPQADRIAVFDFGWPGVNGGLERT